MTAEQMTELRQSCPRSAKAAREALVESTASLRAENERLRALAETLKLEAQIHAGEARTANATIAEIYQCVTGCTGEPGNWHGARPVRLAVEALRGRIAEMEAALRKIVTFHTDRPAHHVGDTLAKFAADALASRSLPPAQGE